MTVGRRPKVGEGFRSIGPRPDGRFARGSHTGRPYEVGPRPDDGLEWGPYARRC